MFTLTLIKKHGFAHISKGENDHKRYRLIYISVYSTLKDLLGNAELPYVC